ncbi:copper resistance protein NlpE [Rufibacter roseus]|uniref:Copper resistance protein NlpE n=1 Tax=Rufibacter roseus TaxID=1567108 RepID=A0ABW2DI59_9BACT|nr:copper resistance protein NlpE [Rufibacter roseus]
MKKLFCLLFVGFTLFACNERKAAEADHETQEQETTAPEVREPYSEQLLVGTFSGIVPCSDCKGIAMTLSLKADNTYTLTEEYQRDQPEQMQSEGTWTLRDKGKELQLLQSGAQDSRDFDVINENQLRLDLLVTEREQDKEAYILKRTQASDSTAAK